MGLSNRYMPLSCQKLGSAAHYILTVTAGHRYRNQSKYYGESRELGAFCGMHWSDWVCHVTSWAGGLHVRR